ncbi:hypothetical protein CF319_g5553 [Tilletia indica]|nr:hypothetical protein CF319_g5553 [Tilletia indica]
MTAPPSTKFAVHKSAAQSLTVQVNELPSLDLIVSHPIDRLLPGSHRRGFGTEAAQRSLHPRITLPSLRLAMRLGARETRSSSIHYIESSHFRASAILRTIVAFLYANADQLNLSEVCVPSETDDSQERIDLVLKPKLRRLHTLGAVATPLRPEHDSNEDRDDQSSESSVESTFPSLHLSLDLIWSTHQKRTASARGKGSDLTTLLHALSQPRAISAPLHPPLMNALRQSLCNRLLQEIKIPLIAHERPLLCGGKEGNPNLVEHKLDLPLFNGVWLDRQENTMPLLRSLAQSLTAISRSSDRRHQTSAQTGADNPLVRRWSEVEKRIGLQSRRVPGLEDTGLDETNADLRFLTILDALMQKDYAKFTPKHVKPKLVDRIPQVSFERATQALQDSSRSVPAASRNTQGDVDKERFEADMIDFPSLSSEKISSNAGQELMFWDEADSEGDPGFFADVEVGEYSRSRLQADLAMAVQPRSLSATPFQPESPPLLAFDFQAEERGISDSDPGIYISKADGKLGVEEEVDSELEAMRSDNELNQTASTHSDMPILSEAEMDQGLHPASKTSDILLNMDGYSSAPERMLMSESDDEARMRWNYSVPTDYFRSSSPELFTLPDTENAGLFCMSE